MTRNNTYLETLTRAVAAKAAPGDLITVDTIRDELIMAQVPPAAYGPMFANACRHGVLMAMDKVRKSTHPSAHGRRVLVYYVRHAAPVADVDLFGNAA